MFRVLNVAKFEYLLYKFREAIRELQTFRMVWFFGPLSTTKLKLNIQIFLKSTAFLKSVSNTLTY